MHKTKKKIKSAKIPKPIKVKKEKTEEDRTLQPMSHYVDDRLELVKQIFGTLKPKTITNLAPDFIKKKNLEEIEELCLNELLGISTKRLMSIINASKCPSDTETSGDSDVNNVEEHISLEEISSDSEIDGGNKTKSKKKLSNANRKDAKTIAEKDANGGQISVLELLELQARARAIRSQLALEPVTKIEVDSDNDDDDATATDELTSNKSRESRSSSGHKQRKRKSSEQQAVKPAKSVKESKPSKTNGGTAINTKTVATTEKAVSTTTQESKQKIKLKRNFRTNRDENNASEKSEEVTTNSSAATVAAPATAQSIVKEERSSRSASPDVIPIVTETVTLMISDSSDDEEEADDVVAIKELKSTKVANENVAKSVEKEQESTVEPASNNRTRKLTEAEDGEIDDDENLKQTAVVETTKQTAEESTMAAEKKNETETITAENTVETTNSSKESSTNLEATQKTADTVAVESSKSGEKSGEKSAETKDEITAAVVADNKTTEAAPSVTATTIVAVDEYDDQNDDIISIEGGDLENEMTEHLEASEASNKTKNDAKKMKEKKIKATQVEEDIISLESTDDELNKQSSESWNTRWLKSSKVSKVLATSRLGKRVRDKIKKSKRTKKDSTREAVAATADAEASKSSSSSYTSKHEDGSMEQYKELLEMRQRKTKND